LPRSSPSSPSPILRRQAERAAGQAPVPITVVAGVAEELPFAVGSFDAAVVSLVLCSVADPRRALAEIRRVIKVGGELRFYEHVQAQEPRLRRLQRLLDYVWPYLAGGCHTSRDTVALIESAGFAMERCRRFSFRPCLLAVPTSPQVIGRGLQWRWCVRLKANSTLPITPTQTASGRSRRRTRSASTASRGRRRRACRRAIAS